MLGGSTFQTKGAPGVQGTMVGAMGHTHNQVTSAGSNTEGLSAVGAGHRDAPPEDDKGQGQRAHLPGLSSPHLPPASWVSALAPCCAVSRQLEPTTFSQGCTSGGCNHRLDYLVKRKASSSSSSCLIGLRINITQALAQCRRCLQPRVH